MLDGPELLKATFTGKALKCDGEGDPRPTFQWIELDANNTTHQGQELILCDAISFKRWMQRGFRNESDLELKFQCVAVRDARVETLNYQVPADRIRGYCPQLSETGERALVSLFVYSRSSSQHTVYSSTVSPVPVMCLFVLSVCFQLSPCVLIRHFGIYA